MSVVATGEATALLEREDSLGALDALLTRVIESARGQLVLLGGQAGVGKTAVLRAFCDAHLSQARVLWGACEPLGTPRPLGPLMDFARAVGLPIRGGAVPCRCRRGGGASPLLRPAAGAGGTAGTDLHALFPGRYLNVMSFKRDGTGIATPVWFVSDGRRLFAFTDLHSAKVRRIRRNPQAQIASCWPNGKLRTAWVPAHAEVLTADADFERVQKLLLDHYRISYRAVMLFYRLGRRLRGKQSVADAAVLAITVLSPPLGPR